MTKKSNGEELRHLEEMLIKINDNPENNNCYYSFIY